MDSLWEIYKKHMDTEAETSVIIFHCSESAIENIAYKMNDLALHYDILYRPYKIIKKTDAKIVYIPRES